MKNVVHLRSAVVLLLLTVIGASFFARPYSAFAVQITQVQVSAITSTSATISWSTDVSVQGLVDYGTTEDEGTIISEDSATTSHSLSLTGLAPATKYYFRIYVDDGGNQQALLDGTPFTTLGSGANPPAATPPPSQTPPPPAVPTYTAADVATHSTSSDCWLIISGKVYDVTQYIPVHPGGAARITGYCGQDATTAFNTKGGSGSHSASAQSLLATFQVGTLATTTTPPPPSQVPPPPAPNPPPTTTGSVYPTGTVAKEANSPTIYFLMGKDKVKIPFANAAAFTGLGYAFAQVKTLNLSAYRLPQTYFIDSANMAHPWGTLTVWKDGTVYLMTPDGTVGIPSMDVLRANGLSSVPIVKMNHYDEMEWERNPNLPPMQVGDTRLL